MLTTGIEAKSPTTKYCLNESLLRLFHIPGHLLKPKAQNLKPYLINATFAVSILPADSSLMKYKPDGNDDAFQTIEW